MGHLYHGCVSHNQTVNHFHILQHIFHGAPRPSTSIAQPSGWIVGAIEIPGRLWHFQHFKRAGKVTNISAWSSWFNVDVWAENIAIFNGIDQLILSEIVGTHFSDRSSILSEGNPWKPLGNEGAVNDGTIHGTTETTILVHETNYFKSAYRWYSEM